MKRISTFLMGCLLLAAIFTLVACNRDEETVDEPAGELQAGTVKILVDQAGMYAVDKAALAEAGLSLETLAADNLALSQGDQPIPFLIDGDQLIFYGAAPDNRYTAYRPYLLRSGATGTQIAAMANSTDAGPRLNQINYTLLLEQENVYVSNARTEENEETWFWQTIRPESTGVLSATIPFVGSGAATATVELYGATYNDSSAIDHDFDLVINGNRVGTIAWDGQTWQQGSLAVPAGTLHTGTNEIIIDNSVPGAVLIDTMQLNWLRLDIEVPPTAVDDRLEVHGVSGLVPMSGFSAPPKVFDVSNASEPIQITGWDFVGGIAEIGIADGQTLLAVGPNGYREPASITGFRASDWRATSNQADLLIVTTDPFIPALEPLVTQRQEQGLTVAVVPLAEIYDEFGYGLESPESIQQFVQYAYENWAEPAPRYLFLVGDASYDYQGFLGPVPASNVPSLIVPVAYSGETVSDTRLADVDGDMKPDLAVGRWPVNSAGEVEDLVARTLAYEAGQASDQAIFTADGTEEQFAVISDRFLAASNLDNERSRRLYGAPADEVTDIWNEGAWLVTYTGHGSLDKWGRDDVLSEEALSDLDEADVAPPIVLQFTCLTGFFAHPSVQSISEALLLNDAGPVLLLGATSLTLSSSQEPLALGLLNELQNPANERIGDALQIAKAGLDVSNGGIREVSDTFGLLGDPSALIIRPGG
ncbi:MAG: hypothetical protein H6651_13130 [Ardenticatenales bacterium]|nr:hypothetical protein [Ardenticatenales bacterium]